MTLITVDGDSPDRLWGLSPRERIRRQSSQIPALEWIDDARMLPAGSAVIIVAGRYVLEARVLEALLGRSGTLLRCESDRGIAAAHVTANEVPMALSILSGSTPAEEASLEVIEAADLGAFDKSLRRAATPLLEPVTPDGRERLETLLYGNAYKGITDLVTKFVWPRPARRAVQWCARAGVTPNAVTLTGLLLVVVAAAAFARGWFVSGLVAAWIMTFLDTVDGKLARVTIRSSRFGHVLDHGMDLLHPPLWYCLWGVGLGEFHPILGLDRIAYDYAIVAGYTLGRIGEAGFHALAPCGIFGWRPFDSYFRLITARRNPCLILLTGSVLAGNPAAGFVAVACWTATSTCVLLGRLAYAASLRFGHGPLQSWLADPEKAARDHPRAFRTFAVTRGAYS